MCGEVNGEAVDLRTVVEEDAAVNILTAKDAEALRRCAILPAM